MGWINEKVVLKKKSSIFMSIASRNEEQNNSVKSSDLVSTDEAAWPEYLFKTESTRVEFIAIEEGFSQLNDYCAFCLAQTANKLAGLRHELEKASKERIIDPVYGEITEDLIMGLTDVDIPVWKDNYDFIAKTMCIILLSFFTEKSLKSLCIAFAPEGKSFKSKKGETKIRSYIVFLKEECYFDFIESPEFVDTREKCREIRNSFAHGDWEDIRTRVSVINLPEEFHAVSNLFAVLESKIYPTS